MTSWPQVVARWEWVQPTASTVTIVTIQWFAYTQLAMQVHDGEPAAGCGAVGVGAAYTSAYSHNP